MYRFLLAALLLFVSPLLSASDSGASITAGQPGFYGQINLGNHYPPPRLIYPDPVVAMPPTVSVPQQPVYLHVPPGHAKKWSKHCHRYNACHLPAYFVQQDWYNDVYAPQYANQHDHPDDRHRDSYRRLDDSGHADDDRRKQSRHHKQSGDHDQFDDGDDGQRGRGKGKQRDRDDHGGQNKRDHERGNRRD